MKRLIITLFAALLATPALALDILLVNDDGWDAPGIQSAFRVLSESGHQVTLVAPLKNQSGRGGAMNTRVGSYVAVNREGERMWSVDGTPTDAVRAGLQVILGDNPPDVVVSGSNFGQNLGRAGAHHSGTVNAALQAAFLGVPAIAISVGVQFQEHDKKPHPFPSTLATFDPAARLVSAVLEGLEASGQPTLLPPGVALNINVPAGWEVERGMRLAPLSAAASVEIHWEVGDRPFGEDGGELRIGFGKTGAPVAGDDVSLFQAGFVTVTPIDGSADTWQPIPGLAGALDYSPGP